MPKEQRRGRRIAMTAEELDRFLGEERTCRVATVGPGGAPHNTPLWFVWDSSALWLHSIVKSQRWADIERNPAVSVVVDAGREYGELRGVEMTGSLEQVGEVPRTSAPDEVLADPERRFAEKYFGTGGDFVSDGRHGWLRLRPEKVVSWDFRKL
ncbi:pyridoxamine 5'-phosphate oxidase family protein [Acidiferrimicrobium sp. IK]|uniref:pyridoxamine 5'-phosphate oxidase family protein n=1 Tax=Acidiferrimicrobium sp. IK TaxID=2871700 RepID=UPI0021CB1BF2|nr:pyridoxamine 5'-phosphate oxidase family protein [Acidiferrimicrobium sp. IK]MCU4183499.1 pyridoxamine 5'-phosphate oxidase family protein [Acidiferrimicrobium sp. IK]